jgi:GAF domain-containing protein
MMIEWESEVHDSNRLAALSKSGLVGTGPEDEFDRLVELAVKLTGAKCGGISLVGTEQVTCKSILGLPEGPPLTLRVIDTFCRYVVGSRRPFIVDDAIHDSRVSDDPAIAMFGIGAWAGFPVEDLNGYILGTLCVIDTRPHIWTESDILVLATLAKAVSTEIALRMSKEELSSVRRELKELQRTPNP